MGFNDIQSNPSGDSGGWQDVFDPFGNVLWKNTAIGQDPGAEQERQRKALLYGQAGRAGDFADYGQASYGQLGTEASGQRDYLRRLASGQDSVSAEQLRQSLGQNLAAQRSLAAGAGSRDQAMAARTAAMQSGRLGAGLAGQQAIAGLAERQQANQALSNMIMQQRQQDLQAALASRQNAMGGYSAQNAGEREKSGMETYGGALAGGAAMMAKSDRRAKTDIRDGDEDANRMLEGLRAFTYRYKDKRDGAGERTGVMAQDLERAGVKHAVVDTPEGKMVHGGHLATANTAMIAALQRRLSKLEGRKAA